ILQRLNQLIRFLRFPFHSVLIKQIRHFVLLKYSR
ncbi:unnamed protein product, partial [Callosobruchus maculatus]